MNKVVINNRFGGFGLSKVALEYLREKHGLEVSSYQASQMDRHDIRLVDTVEALGSDVASDAYAKLEVVEIEGNHYIIDEYDGSEGVETPDSIFWVVIDDGLDINELRKEFESIEKISKMLPKDNAFIFDESSNMYFDYHEYRGVVDFINGAWFIFWEMNK